MVEFTGKRTSYYFEGETIPQPAPGTYDADAWTPPPRKRYRVDFEHDETNAWSILQNDAVVKTGSWEPASQANAKRLLLAFIKEQERIKQSFAEVV